MIWIYGIFCLGRPYVFEQVFLILKVLNFRIWKIFQTGLFL